MRERLSIALISACRQQTQRITLEHISWSTYQALLQDLGNCQNSRLIYNQGSLEVILPCDFHEIIIRSLTTIVTKLAEILNIPVRSYGTLTIEQEDLACAVEPDACFEVLKSTHQGVHTNFLAPLISSVPTLVIDIDIDRECNPEIRTDINPHLHQRLQIYSKLQIAEVWQYSDRHGMVIYQLQGDHYHECNVSPTFPCISGVVLCQFLQLAETLSDDHIFQVIQQWLEQPFPPLPSPEDKQENEIPELLWQLVRADFMNEQMPEYSVATTNWDKITKH